MNIAYKQVAVAGALGILFGWFFARKLSTIAYQLHMPRPDWDMTGHVGSGFDDGNDNIWDWLRHNPPQPSPSN